MIDENSIELETTKKLICKYYFEIFSHAMSCLRSVALKTILLKVVNKVIVLQDQNLNEDCR